MIQKWYNRILWASLLLWAASFVIMIPLGIIFDAPPRGIMEWMTVSMMGVGGIMFLLLMLIGGVTGHFGSWVNSNREKNY